MIRFAGFLLGVALVVAASYQFDRQFAPQTGSVLSALEPAAQTTVVADRDADVSHAMQVPELADEVAMASGQAPSPALQAVAFFEEDLAPEALPVATAVEVTPAEPAIPSDVAESAFDARPVPQETPVVQWQAIWQAFGARRSAQGFAARLETLTGLDYRVDKLGPGQYQVAFSYSSDGERLQALSRIEQTTGLVMTQHGDDAG